MLNDSKKHFGTISIFNHWVAAALIILLLALGLYLEDLPDGPDKWQILNLHKSLGMLMLFLGVWRVSWRLYQGFPEHVEGVLAWEKKAAALAHYLLLVCILILPVSGYVYSETAGYNVSFFGLFNMPSLPDSNIASQISKTVHAVVGKIIMLVIFLHIGAAIKHHFINKDQTLKRMFGR